MPCSATPEAAGERADPDPFDLPGRGGSAALCLHGLTGTPYEVRPLGEALAAAGVRALGPTLPGHVDTPERLAATRAEDWRAAAQAHLSDLRARHDRVFLVGLSMGGLLSLDLASGTSVDGLVVVGVPLRFPRWLTALLPLARRLRPYVSKRVGSDIREPGARRRHPSLEVMPLAAVQQLTCLQRRVRRRLAGVRAPILVAHGRHDRTANPADAREIFDGVGSERRELRIFESSGHVVPVDYDGADLADATVAFLSGCA